MQESPPIAFDVGSTSLYELSSRKRTIDILEKLAHSKFRGKDPVSVPGWKMVTEEARGSLNEAVNSLVARMAADDPKHTLLTSTDGAHLRMTVNTDFAKQVFEDVARRVAGQIAIRGGLTWESAVDPHLTQQFRLDLDLAVPIGLAGLPSQTAPPGTG